MLSPSTEAWDRGRTLVEHYTPQPDGATWSLTDVSDPGGVVRLASVGIELPMTEIYEA